MIGSSGRWPRGRVLAVALLVAAVAVSVGTLISRGAPAGAAPSLPAAPAECTPGETKVSGVIPDGCYGEHPVSAYDISYKVGVSPSSWGANIMGFLTKLAFNVGTWFVSLAQWAIGWAFKFPIGDYTEAATSLSESYRVRIFGGELGVSLFTVAWTVLFAYVGFNVLRSKASMALGELVTSVVLVACSVFFVGHLGGYVRAMWDLESSAGAAMLVAANPESDIDPATAGRDDIDRAVFEVQQRLHTVFIAESYDLINWGEPLRGACADQRDKILEDDVDTSAWFDFRDTIDIFDTGLLGTGDNPYQLMADRDGCDVPAAFNAKPTSGRLGSALLCMAASIAVGLVLTAMALTMVVGNFAVVVLFGLAPFLMLLAAFPGAGRRLGWMWLTTLVQAVLVDLGIAFLLSMMLTVMRIVLDVTAANSDGSGGRPLIERMVLVLCLVLVMSAARTRMIAGGQGTAGRIADNLTNVRLGGGGAAWQGPQGTRGFDFGKIGASFETGARRALLVGTAAVALGAGRLFQERMRERRMWHNTVKARLMGDQLSAVTDRGYIGSDPVGSASGVMVRNGFPDPAGLPPGVGPGLPPGAGGLGGLPGGGAGELVLADRHGRVIGRDEAALGADANLWQRAIRAYEGGDKAQGMYFQKMAQLHHNYESLHARPGATDPRGRYERQALAVREEYMRAAGVNVAPEVDTPWASPGLGHTRPDAIAPPIAAPGKSRRFDEVVRQAQVLPSWGWRKPWLWSSMHRGRVVQRQAPLLAEQTARQRGYDI